MTPFGSSRAWLWLAAASLGVIGAGIAIGWKIGAPKDAPDSCRSALPAKLGRQPTVPSASPDSTGERNPFSTFGAPEARRSTANQAPIRADASSASGHVPTPPTPLGAEASPRPPSPLRPTPDMRVDGHGPVATETPGAVAPPEAGPTRPLPGNQPAMPAVGFGSVPVGTPFPEDDDPAAATAAAKARAQVLELMGRAAPDGGR